MAKIRWITNYLNVWFFDNHNKYNQDFYKISLSDICNVSLQSKQILLNFLSPLRLIHDGRLVKSKTFSFSIYAKRLLERLRALGYFHDNLFWFDIEDSFISEAQDIKSENYLQWQDWDFFVDNRPRKIGGLVGQVILYGDLKPFFSILNAAQWLHVGKNTTYGFGAVNIQY